MTTHKLCHSIPFSQPFAALAEWVPRQYVVFGTPHCNPNALGTVIRVDQAKNIRSREPMTYMTPGVDVTGEHGYSFKAANGAWQDDGEDKGRLFKNPYPLSA